MKFLNPNTIQLSDTFSKKYIIKKHTLNKITKSMIDNGFDITFPLLIWKEKNILIDGHTRLTAAKVAKLNSVPVSYISFKSENEVMTYIESIQENRRNLDFRDHLHNLIQNGYYEAKNKKRFVADYFNCSERTAVNYTNILKNPEKVDEVMQSELEVVSIGDFIEKPKKKKDSDRKKKIVNDISRKLNAMTLKELAEIKRGLGL